jgi:hypothetical protein
MSIVKATSSAVQYTTSCKVAPRKSLSLGVGDTVGVAGWGNGVIDAVAVGAMAAVGIGVLQFVVNDSAKRKNKSGRCRCIDVIIARLPGMLNTNYDLSLTAF